MTDPRAEAERLLKVQSDEYALWTEDEQTRLGVAVRVLLDQIATLTERAESAEAQIAAYPAVMGTIRALKDDALTRRDKAEATVATLTAERAEARQAVDVLLAYLDKLRNEMPDNIPWAEQIDTILKAARS